MEMMYPTITMWELERWIACGKTMYLVDLRNQESFCRCHLMGAVNIPMDELEERLDEFPTGIPIVLYCSRGSKSMLACNHLWDRGYQVVNVGGGLVAYRGKYMVRS